jgi:hypothetical protein
MARLVYYRTKLFIFCTLLALISIGCTTHHEVDTFPEWCEQISGVDLSDKYNKPWTPFFAVSFKGDAIRDDFMKSMNETYNEKMKTEDSGIMWREGTELHLVNPSSFYIIEPEEFISEWKNKIQLSKTYSLTDRSEICIYGTMTSLFDTIIIHSYEFDDYGLMVNDNTITIDAERRTRLGERLL